MNQIGQDSTGMDWDGTRMDWTELYLTLCYIGVAWDWIGL